MYIDLIVFIILVAAVIFFFRRFSSFVYLVCALDIFFRLLHFLADHMGVAELTWKCSFYDRELCWYYWNNLYNRIMGNVCSILYIIVLYNKNIS